MTTLTIFLNVLFMGFTCSMGCGTISTPFLLGSLLGDGGTISESRRAITVFSIGKVVSLMFMGLMSAIFGNIILSNIEQLYPNATIWVIKIATILFGSKILYNTIRYEFLPNKSENTSGCSSCSGCKSQSSCGSANIKNNDEPRKSYFFAGLLYATIPCGPLLTCLAYASTMNIITAMILLGLFGIVNSIIPVFFLASVVGLANDEFTKNSAKYLKFVKLSGGIILIYAAIFQV